MGNDDRESVLGAEFMSLLLSMQWIAAVKETVQAA
jgi:hypothetical protein